MDISTISPAMAQASIVQQLGITLTTQALDISKQQSEAVLQMLPQVAAPQTSLTPHLGQQLDVRA